MAEKVREDPSSSDLQREILLSAAILLIIGIILVIFAKVVAGVIIALLGAVFGVGSQVAKNTKI